MIFGFFLAFFISIANASPLNPGQVEVVDGDTIRVAGETFRLVGFDAPETYRARLARALAGNLDAAKNTANSLEPTIFFS